MIQLIGVGIVLVSARTEGKQIGNKVLAIISLSFVLMAYTIINYCACTAPGSLDTRLSYAAWRSSCSSRASIGV